MSDTPERSRAVLEMWAVYSHPKDYPEKFVARKWLGDQPTAEIILGDTVEEVRKNLPPALFRIPRVQGDDPAIVEVWL